jgi:hypothetical protein
MPAPKPGAKKDSTNEVPMFDLGEIMTFVTTIHEKGLETESMPEVAKGCGYKHATSTPFYRRMVAGRLFGLLSKTGAELTPRAKDVLKPDSDGAERRALIDSINSVAFYAETLIQLSSGKRLVVDLIANRFSRSLNLTDPCAAICARAFEGSLKFAGLLAPDGTVLVTPIVTTKDTNRQGSTIEQDRDEEDENQAVSESPQTQKHTLYLDKTKSKKFTVIAPLALSFGEIKRIQKWIEVTLLIESEELEQRGPS